MWKNKAALVCARCSHRLLDSKICPHWAWQREGSGGIPGNPPLMFLTTRNSHSSGLLSHAGFAISVLLDPLFSYWSFQTQANFPLGTVSPLGFLIKLQFLIVYWSLKRGQEGDETTTLLHLSSFIFGIASGLTKKILCTLFPIET